MAKNGDSQMAIDSRQLRIVSIARNLKQVLSRGGENGEKNESFTPVAKQ